MASTRAGCCTSVLYVLLYIVDVVFRSPSTSGGVRLPLVSYHESFWLTIGAAAPVIALAIIVSLADSFDMRVFFKIASFPERLPAGDDSLASFYRKVIRKSRRRGGQVYALGLTNMALQAAMLAVALYSLAQRHDTIPLLLAVIVEPLGVLALAWASLGTIRMHSARRNFEEYRHGLSGH